ncbi:MAG: polyprenyl synthetase family protein [Planctomycetota bacterium]|nr:polyprenyl synthetase family protein [Planctomycetota bacterium]MCX8039661.1 polyprenyl synthetase family protein [Planctomycetota bacterium]MDW8372239.1 polyprenyl synthetase family protein [Planctomycetota bacterium]
MPGVAELLSEAAALAERALDARLPAADEPPARLHQAMRYAVFAGGKRLRPALVLASCRACGGDAAAAEPALAAVELLHTYTLVHDDLPAMDDDDLRRGRPTCHRAFDEATAILAGDALQAAAFAAAAELGAEAVQILARAAGSRGVVGGQQEDLEAEGQPGDLARLERIHRGKTAALLAASCELGALAAGAGPGRRAALAAFGEALGLAFQYADDVLDATASAAQLGKTPGKDAAAGKLTAVAVLGLDGARTAARDWCARALAALERCDGCAEPLRALARFVVERDR